MQDGCRTKAETERFCRVRWRADGIKYDTAADAFQPAARLSLQPGAWKPGALGERGEEETRGGSPWIVGQIRKQAGKTGGPRV